MKERKRERREEETIREEKENRIVRERRGGKQRVKDGG